MATQNLPSTGQTNWGDTLNKYLSVSTNENGGLYTFETEAERDFYFDGSTMFKTLDEGKTCVIKTGNKIQKREGTSWVTKFEGGGAKTNPNDYTADPADYAGFIQTGWKIGGGIVFWTDGTNGLIVAPTDDSARQWKTSDTNTANTNSEYDGLANTNAMIAAGASLHPAAQACVNKSIYGFSGWFLPANHQLHYLYSFWWPDKNFQNVEYWSSTQHYDQYARIYQLGNIGTSMPVGSGNKTESKVFRAIRNF